MNIICDLSDCTACFACLNACKQDAISFTPNDLGALYPTINQERCINCERCRKVCPTINPPLFQKPIASYVGCTKSSQEQLSSTSGGIASGISRLMLKEKGVIYGCTSQNPQDVRHIRIEDEKDIKLLKGSKYVQSRIGSIYRDVLSDLKEGKNVVFIGTPCQIAGLKGFLHKDFSNLYTIDFVCHGVPPQKILNESIDLLTRGVNAHDITIQFRFRDKHNISKYGILLKDNSGKVVLRQIFPKCDYILGFLEGLFYRENCYQCKYARPERVSDITLGDYSDSEEKFSKMQNARNGLSKIIVNSQKGMVLLKKSESTLSLSSIHFDFLVKSGGQLVKPMKRHAEQPIFQEIYLSQGLNAAYKAILPNIRTKIKRRIIINSIIRCLYKIPLAKELIKTLKKHITLRSLSS